MARAKSEGPHPIDKEVGRRVCALRLSRGFGQAELAKALNLTFQQVQKYEKGANRISASKLWLIADFFGVEVGYFFPTRDEATSQAINVGPAMDRRAHDMLAVFDGLDIEGKRALIDVARYMAGLKGQRDVETSDELKVAA